MTTQHLGAFRQITPLDDITLRAHAPSIFTDTFSGRMSDRYSQLPTIQVVNGLRANGFLPFAVAQSASKSDGMFSKHMVRFRHASAPVPSTGPSGGEYDEIVLINSHDGSSAFQLMQGVFRFVCLNGMIVGSTTASIAIKHSGDIVSNVIEGATRILEDSANVLEMRETMKAIELEQDERRAFASAALQLRYGDHSPITADSLLTPRRREDEAFDLWRTFNVVQENMVKGHVSGRSINTGRRMQTRGITSITQDVAVNRMLWNLAEAARNMKDTLVLDGIESVIEV